MFVESCGLTDVGQRRSKNEDSFLINGSLSLYIVADGMGGHLGGEFASRLAIETVEATVASLVQEGKKDYKDWLQRAIGEASLKIYKESCQNPKLKGMGTTVVAFFFRDNKVYVGNVGDSRAYRIHEGKIKQLTIDHSLVNEQIEAGILSPKEAKAHRLKNIITRSVGFQEDVEVDCQAKTVRSDDTYLLCSDGLYNLLSDEEILEIISNHPVKEACRYLIDVANSRGGDDNITVIVARPVFHGDFDEEESTLRV